MIWAILVLINNDYVIFKQLGRQKNAYHLFWKSGKQFFANPKTPTQKRPINWHNWPSLSNLGLGWCVGVGKKIQCTGPKWFAMFVVIAHVYLILCTNHIKTHPRASLQAIHNVRIDSTHNLDTMFPMQEIFKYTNSSHMK